MKLHEFIAQQRDPIVSRILETIDGHAHSERMPSVPGALDELIDALREDEPPARSPAGIRHGHERLHSGQSIEIVAHDFGSVCDSILSEAMAHGYTPTAREFQLLNLTLDEAIAAAVHEYWAEAHEEFEQVTNKRTGMLIHELRNTLHSVTLAFRIIVRGQVGTTSRTASMLDRGLKRMENLLEHALAAVKTKAGVDLARTRVRIIDLIHDVEAANAPSRGVTLRTEATEDLELDADVFLLTSALGNLVSNALKFTRDGTVVTVRARPEGSRVVIEVEDECGGLPSGKPEELFAPFVQRGRDRRGVGLGLAIVHDAAEAHGGRVQVRDLPGKGCIFALDLPRAQAR